MKNFLISVLVLLLLGFLGAADAHAQGRLIRKMQEKVEDKIIEEVFGEPEKKQPAETAPGEAASASPAKHRKGGGLSQTIPDVNLHIGEAHAAYDKQSYAEAKSAVRQALWGVELEIGRKILESLPESVEGLNTNPDEDHVTSTGAGFLGLVIERTYQGKDDLELRVSIGSDAAVLGLAGFYVTSGMYTATTDDPNRKQIRFKGHNASISYDDYDGYTLGVPFGQSSVFVVSGSNYDSEDQFMAAANHFDIDRIKKELGE